ncbi:cytidylate kinase [Bacteroidia bacterium]|nr:cytidylate kinase [Bacteroidia bacterium]
MKKWIVAIDGYSSTGKSTVAKLLAVKLRAIYIDTGAMYRAVTLYAMQNGFISDGKIAEKALEENLSNVSIQFVYNAAKKQNETVLNGVNVENEIRGMDVSGFVSPISGLAFVRTFLVEQQREMGRNGRVVLDGRDIGSVVFPNADVKFFLTSLPSVRAERRFKELRAKGVDVTYEEVEANVHERDYQDEHRAVSPLLKVDDAILIDNSYMTLEEEVEAMMKHIEKKCHVS